MARKTEPQRGAVISELLLSNQSDFALNGEPAPFLPCGARHVMGVFDLVRTGQRCKRQMLAGLASRHPAGARAD